MSVGAAPASTPVKPALAGVPATASALLTTPVTASNYLTAYAGLLAAAQQKMMRYTPVKKPDVKPAPIAAVLAAAQPPSVPVALKSPAPAVAAASPAKVSVTVRRPRRRPLAPAMDDNSHRSAAIDVEATTKSPGRVITSADELTDSISRLSIAPPPAAVEDDDSGDVQIITATSPPAKLHSAAAATAVVAETKRISPPRPPPPQFVTPAKPSEPAFVPESSARRRLRRIVIDDDDEPPTPAAEPATTLPSATPYLDAMFESKLNAAPAALAFATPAPKLPRARTEPTPAAAAVAPNVRPPAATERKAPKPAAGAGAPQSASKAVRPPVPLFATPIKKPTISERFAELELDEKTKEQTVGPDDDSDENGNGNGGGDDDDDDDDNGFIVNSDEESESGDAHDSLDDEKEEDATQTSDSDAADEPVKPKKSNTKSAASATATAPPAAAPKSKQPKADAKPAKESHRSFVANRDRYCAELYAEFNRRVFKDMLPADMSITWNKRLLKTAGFCRCANQRNPMSGELVRSAKIELSTKVLDNYRKLRSTLVHEMTHAANWLIDRLAKLDHGSEFRRWAVRVRREYPDISMSTCHAYEIFYKFRWQCTNPHCGHIVGRHSNSLDITKKVCASCRAKFVYLGTFQPVAGGEKAGVAVAASGGKPKARKVDAAGNPILTPFAAFVKEQYRVLKTPNTPHKEVMQLLSAAWKERKAQTPAVATVTPRPVAQAVPVVSPTVQLSLASEFEAARAWQPRVGSGGGGGGGAGGSPVQSAADAVLADITSSAH